MAADQERESVRTYISQRLDGRTVGDGENLFEAGYVNSLFAVQLVMWIERTFDITVQGDDLDFANIASIDAITSFVQRKKAMVH